MQATHRIISRDVIARVRNDFINQQRVDTSSLPRSVAESIASRRFTREQLNRSFANARKREAASIG